MSDVIYEDKARNLIIRRETTYTSALVALLEQTVWGTRGVLYTMHEVAAVLDRIVEPHFLSLKENDELVAVAVRSRKTTRVGGEVYSAFHLAMLAVESAKVGQGYGRLLAEQSRHYFLNEVGERGMLYGYIEAGNARSLQLNQKLGYRFIGQFHTTMFSRLWPNDNVHVRRLEETERATLVQLLNDQYADYALVDFDQSVRADEYYVWEQAGEIVAGVQTERLHWTIVRLPGARGAILVKTLPYLPLLRRLFDARDYHFLRLGNIYARPGHEAKIFTLIEALLARQHLHSGMAFMDKHGPVYQRMAAAGTFGVLNMGMGAAMHVIADFNRVPEEEIAEIQRRPLCLSPMDVL
jgi:L-amino acid N-acyltransferase YncA